MSEVSSKVGRFIQTHFLSANPPNIIPSPQVIVENVKNAVENFRIHCDYAQRQQASFQDHLQSIGISRLSNMSFEETIADYNPPPAPRKKGEKQTVIRLKWQSFDPDNF